MPVITVIMAPPQNWASQEQSRPSGDARDSAQAPQRQGRALLLKVPETAAELRIGLTKMYGLINAQEIRSRRVGPSAIRIPVSEVEAFIAQKLG